MRDKMMDREIIKRILIYRGGLPKNYSMDILKPETNNKKTIDTLEAKLFPSGVRKKSDFVDNLFQDSTSFGFLLFNKKYVLGRSAVAYLIMNYDEKFDLKVMDDRLKGDRIDYDSIDYDFETSTIVRAGVLPGEPLRNRINEVILDLAVVSAKDTCCQDIAYPIWEKDNMLKVIPAFGFDKKGTEPEKAKNGDNVLVFKKDTITPGDYIRCMADLCGPEWFFKEYLKMKDYSLMVLGNEKAEEAR